MTFFSSQWSTGDTSMVVRQGGWGTGFWLPLSTAVLLWWVPVGRKEWDPLPGVSHNDFKSKAESAAFWGHLAIQD